MEEKPKVIITSSRRKDLPAKSFNFTEEDILPGHLFELRKNAWETYKLIPFPTTVEESWRRSDLRLMPTHFFKLPSENVKIGKLKIPASIRQPLLSTNPVGRVILVAGGSETNIGQEIMNQGVIYSDLRSAEQSHPETLAHVAGQIVPAGDGKFAALATAFSQNGIFLYVPKGVTLDAPLSGIIWGASKGAAVVSHLVIWLDEGSSVKLLVESASPTLAGDTLHVSNIEILVGKEASLQFIDLQSFGNNTWNFTHARARVEENGNLDWIFGAVGSKFTKSFMNIDLVGAGARGRMSGFYFTDGKQHLDLDTQQDHHAPNTTSDLLFKGALSGESRVVWQGMIYVSQNAQKTDGYQANRNLILGKGARADSIPGLEILADDVRCTHGATVSKLEEDPLFYLQSRGIPERESEQLLVQGFFDPIMGRIPFPNVRRKFQQVINNKMKK